MNQREVSIWPNRIYFETGGVGRLEKIAESLGAKRAMVVCGRTVANGDMLERVEKGLGDRFAGVFSGVRSHTPLDEVKAAADMARSFGADVLISVGGGSAIDAAKGIALLLVSNGDLEPYRIQFDQTGSMDRKALPDSILPHIAVPTTSGSASEVMPTAGIRDTEQKKKMLFWDNALLPKVVILDPEMAVQTPPELTAASGMTAVTRCIETLYSRNSHPISTGLALHALRLMNRSLPRAVAEPDNLVARGECQFACAMSGTAAINAMVSVVHSIGHIIGGRYGLQHGVSHSILLAPAMRLLLPTMGADQSLVLAALGRKSEDMDPDTAGQRAADAMEALVASLPLKQRLSDLGMTKDELPEIAGRASRDYMMVNVPRPVTEHELLELMQSVW